MKCKNLTILPILLTCVSFFFGGCAVQDGEDPSAVIEGNGFIILGTLTDQFDRAKAKANVEDTLSRHPDISCMVGLFEYNPPLILEALEQANKIGKVKVVAFDENDRTLKGIQDGQVEGTIAQDPYMYGYKSMEYLAKLHKGEGKPRLAFVTNGVAPFWTIAEKGALKAKEDLDVEVDIVMPSGGITDQKDKVEDLITRKVDGIAISPIDADNQTELINKAADRTNVVTHDSDAPASNRLCYIGMDNYDAGLMCAELVKKAIPDGGKVMIFVGRMEQDNAKHRRQGLIDGLIGKKREKGGVDLPEEMFIHVPAQTITKDNVDDFWSTLKKRLGKE
jgi:ribose transport system substrate-binding protein